MSSNNDNIIDKVNTNIIIILICSYYIGWRIRLGTIFLLKIKLYSQVSFKNSPQR